MKFHPEVHLKSPMPEKEEPKESSSINVSELHFPRNTAIISEKKKMLWPTWKVIRKQELLKIFLDFFLSSRHFFKLRREPFPLSVLNLKIYIPFLRLRQEALYPPLHPIHAFQDTRESSSAICLKGSHFLFSSLGFMPSWNPRSSFQLVCP